MKIKFYQYPRCTTCKKAKQWLIDNKIDFEDIDITKNTPTKDELIAYHKLSNLDEKKFFNTSGILYRELALKDKLPTMSYDEKFELLSSDGKLIKRPLVILEDSVLLGFKEDEWKVSISQK